jgi:hypothetical protein
MQITEASPVGLYCLSGRSPGAKKSIIVNKIASFLTTSQLQQNFGDLLANYRQATRSKNQSCDAANYPSGRI